MASLKEIKTRIGSVKSTLKITSAMKMVASAKLRKAQLALGNKLPYERQLHRILAGMLQDDDLQKAIQDELGLGNPHGHSPVVLQDIHVDELPKKDHVGRVAVVVFSSNSSLCGAFNANVIRYVTDLFDKLYDAGYSKEDIDIYAAGKKVADALQKAGFMLKKELHELVAKPDYEKSSALAESLIDSFITGEVSQVMIIYSHFASPVSQPVVKENYLPLALHDYDRGAEPLDYILEPDPLSLVRDLLPLVLMLKIYSVVLDAAAAEHAARTMAMQIASDNAENLISELTLAYNKGRQQEITAEILDLVGGTMA